LKRILYKGKIPVFPLNYNEQDSNFFYPHYEYKLLKPYLKKISFGFMLKNGTALDNLLNPIPESLPWRLWANSYNKKYWIGYILKAIIKADVGLKLNSKKIVVVFNNFSCNYFHWITEVLPKIMYLKHLDKNFCFLFPDTYKQDYQKATLKIMNVNVAYFSKSLIYFRGFNFFSGFSEYPGYYEPDSILAVRSMLIKNCLNPKAACDFVYVSRNKAARRKVINEDEIQVILLKYDFKIFYFEELSFFEIAEISRKAKVLVSIHGAALTNMIFMEKGSTIFELKKQNVIEDKCYFFLANTLEMKYYYQTCKSKNEEDSHIFADIYVDVQLFEKNIELIMSTIKLIKS